MSQHHEALLAERTRVAPFLAAQGERLCRDLARWLEEAGIKVHSVTARVKTHESLARKLARPDRSYAELWDVTDLLGIRVITYFGDAVDRAARVVETRLPVDLGRSIDKRRTSAPGTFGYRSMHYVFGVVDPDGALPPQARGELQVRTVLEHTWAEIEHDLGYKAPGAVPEPVRRRLSRVAGLLELADLEFVAIRDELAAYARALPGRIAEGWGDDVPLDELALTAVIRSADVAAIDRAIAEAQGRELGDDVFFPDYLLRMLQLVGLSTVADLRERLERHAPALPAFAAPYFQFAWSAWRVAPTTDDRMLRGYAVFFLAHACVLEGAHLALDKVERLARLYHQLDYPDDPGAAQRVASQLIEALRGVTAR